MTPNLIMDEKGDRPKVALIGPYPPPYGGVSIHIQRLQALLSNNGIQSTVYDASPHLRNTKGIMSLRKIKSWVHIVSRKNKIIHIHSSGLSLKMITPLCCLIKLRRRKFIITYHSLRDDIEHFNRFNKWVIRIILSFASHIISVSPEVKEKLLLLSVSPEKISVIPAFLPPAIKEQEIDEIPQEVWNFVNSHTPVISANAFRIVLFKGQDRYGIDMCVDLCANLKGAYPEIGFVFCLPDIGDYDYFFKLKQRIAEKNIGNNFLFVTEPCQYYPILMKSHVFVRPTNTDGDAVSLREALYFKTPSVASDAVLRPRGTIYLKNRDINDFTWKVKDLLANYEYYKGRLETVRLEDNFEKILEVYQRLAQ